MNSAQAREILMLYRDEGDASVEGMLEAFELLGKDPDLKQWFDHTQVTRAGERAALRGLSVPPGLREAILRERKIVPLWKRRGFLTAIAASVAVSIGGLVFLNSRRNEVDASLQNFEQRMLGYAIRSYGMDIESDDPKRVRELLARKNVPSDFTLPPKVEALTVMGGAALKWQNHPVAMMCFKMQDQTGYLFVIEERHLAQVEGDTALLGSFSELSTAVWRKNGKVYLLGAKMTQEELKKLLT